MHKPRQHTTDCGINHINGLFLLNFDILISNEVDFIEKSIEYRLTYDVTTLGTYDYLNIGRWISVLIIPAGKCSMFYKPGGILNGILEL